MAILAHSSHPTRSREMAGFATTHRSPQFTKYATDSKSGKNHCSRVRMHENIRRHEGFLCCPLHTHCSRQYVRPLISKRYISRRRFCDSTSWASPYCLHHSQRGWTKALATDRLASSKRGANAILRPIEFILVEK